MGRIFGLILSIPMFVLFPFVLLIVFFAPMMCLSEGLHMLSSGAPANVFPLAGVGLIGMYLFMSMRWQRMRILYSKIPVLLPGLQIAFIMFALLDTADIVIQAWADHEAFPKSAVMILSAILLVLGRLYLSYWYAKHPISSKVRR
jgi:hypothetical protein